MALRDRFRKWRWARYLRRHGTSYRWPAEGIMCFHCGRRFKSYWRARLHFGETPPEGAACTRTAREVELLRGRIERLEREAP